MVVAIDQSANRLRKFAQKSRRFGLIVGSRRSFRGIFAVLLGIRCVYQRIPSFSTTSGRGLPKPSRPAALADAPDCRQRRSA